MRRNCLWLAAALLIGAATTPPRAQAAKLALLVGVNEYPHLSPQYQLRGCENDARLMAALLTAKFGFAEPNVHLLLSREATRDAIARAFRTQIIERARAGDVVFFHFSGHGSQMEDTNGDEEDGLDETLVPADVGPETVDRQITDDEIATWLAELRRKGVRDITFVVDACHSGTITKDILLETDLSRPRYIDPFDLTGRPAQPKEVPLEARERTGLQEAPEDAVVISGCKAEQQSNDARFGATFHGALTYFLHAALQQAAPSTTYADLMRDVQRRVQERFPTQTPQLDGRGDRPVLLGNETAPTRPFVVVTRAEAQSVELAAGSSAGVTPGSTYVVYPGNDNALTGPGIGRVAVTAVETHSAQARVLRGGSAIRAGCRAVPETHCYLPEQLWVRVDGKEDLPAAFAAALRERLDYVAITEGDRAADRVVKLSRAEGGLTAAIVTPDGLPGRLFTAATVAALADAVRPELENAYTIKLLARLENPNPSFRVRLSFDREANPVYYFGRDRVSFRVQADRDCYITVLDIGTSGRITVLFPNRFHTDNFVRAGQTYVLPAPGRPTFQIQVSPPVGREMVKVIATEKPVNLTGLNYAAMQETFASLPDSLGFATQLASRVRDFVVTKRPQPQQEDASAGVPTAGWATDFITFQVRDPKERKE